MINDQQTLHDSHQAIREAVIASREELISEQLSPEEIASLCKTDITFTLEELDRACIRAERGDGDLLIRLFRDRYVFDHRVELWYRRGEHHWHQDSTLKVMAATRPLAEAYENAYIEYSVMAKDAAKAGDKEALAEYRAKRNAIIKKVVKMNSRKHLENSLAFSTYGDDALGIEGDQWDRIDYLLPVENGCVNLNTGRCPKGKPSNWIRKWAPTEWHGLNTPCPLWERTLGEIFLDHPEIIPYMRRLFGYAIAGYNIEHVLPIMFGRGRNGKGTIVETISRILGPLSEPIKAEMLLRQDRTRSSSGADADLIALMGLRLVWASETNESRRLNEGKVKWLTGGDTIVARPLYKKQLTFEPTHTTFLLTNNKPKVKSDDFAMWQRLHLIPFEREFVKRPDPNRPNQSLADPDLPQKLMGEASGILAWMVRGHLEWKEKGLDPPRVILAATEEYRLEEDSIRNFISENCECADYAKIRAGVFMTAYREWCKNEGIEPETAPKIGEYMKEYYKVRTGGSRAKWYHGVGLPG